MKYESAHDRQRTGNALPIPDAACRAHLPHVPQLRPRRQCRRQLLPAQAAQLAAGRRHHAGGAGAAGQAAVLAKVVASLQVDNSVGARCAWSSRHGPWVMGLGAEAVHTRVLHSAGGASAHVPCVGRTLCVRCGPGSPSGVRRPAVGRCRARTGLVLCSARRASVWCAPAAATHVPGGGSAVVSHSARGAVRAPSRPGPTTRGPVLAPSPRPRTCFPDALHGFSRFTSTPALAPRGSAGAPSGPRRRPAAA